MNPGIDPESWSRMGSRKRNAIIEFYRESKKGVFADDYPKLNVGLLSQIQRHKLDFRGRQAAPAVSRPVRGDKRVMQTACATDDLRSMYEGEVALQDGNEVGVNLFFKEDMIIPPGRSFIIPLGVSCRLVPSANEMSPLCISMDDYSKEFDGCNTAKVGDSSRSDRWQLSRRSLCVRRQQ